MNELATELFAEICRIPCVNSHSHLPPETERLAQDIDALLLFKHAYLHADTLDICHDSLRLVVYR